MADAKTKSVGTYLLRIVAVVGVILGILMVLVGLTQPNLVGLILGVALTVGAATALKRSGRSSRT